MVQFRSLLAVRIHLLLRYLFLFLFLASFRGGGDFVAGGRVGSAQEVSARMFVIFCTQDYKMRPINSRALLLGRDKGWRYIQYQVLEHQRQKYALVTVRTWSEFCFFRHFDFLPATFLSPELRLGGAIST